MVYFEHATNPVVFGTLLTLYYLAIPSAFIAWYWRNHIYLSRGNPRLKSLLTYLFIAFVITSLASYKIVSIYLYIHSPGDGRTCFSSSCVLSAGALKKYNIEVESLKDLGVPSYGLMTVYRIYDTGKNATLGLPVLMNYVVVVRPLIVLPMTEVTVYVVSGTRAVVKKTFYVTWPRSPGGVLTRELDVRFTVLIVSGSGGPGV